MIQFVNVRWVADIAVSTKGANNGIFAVPSDLARADGDDESIDAISFWLGDFSGVKLRVIKADKMAILQERQKV